MYYASVAELVDALDLGSSGVTRESSSLSTRTILNNITPLFSGISLSYSFSWVTFQEVFSCRFPLSLAKVLSDK